jgi:glycosyltransferase involved in cell wall biosynthesis
MSNYLEIDPPFVIRNLPEKTIAVSRHGGTNANPLRKAFGISNDEPLVLYQGGIVPGRGVSTVIEAFSKIEHPLVKLVFLGDGAPSTVEEILKAAQEPQFEGRIFYHQAVSPAELFLWTRDATIGLAPIEGTHMSYRYCLPNKLFEYIQAGLPVVATDLVEMTRIIREYGVGDVFRDRDPDDLARVLDRLLEESGRLAQYRKHAKKAAEVLTWEVEKHRLVDIYRSLL